jgi:hypothetical protein
MREFKDDEGRPWRVALTVGSALRVRDMVTVETDELGPDGEPTGKKTRKPFDLVDVGTITQTLQVLRNQYATVGEVLYAILIAQVDERKLNKETFLEGLRGDALDAGARALEEELVDFFPLRLRRMVGLLATKMDEVTSELLEQAEAGLATVTAATLSGAQSGRPLASSASTPGSGPSDSSSPPGPPDSTMTGGTPPTSSAA